MADTVIEFDYHVILPEEVRSHVTVGQRYAVTVNAEGSLVLTPVEQPLDLSVIDSILNQTAGMWRDRSDVPQDGVEYVNQLRQARRLENVVDYHHGH